MTLTLKNFKQVIAPAILERGRRYAQGRNIIDLELVDEGEWLAQVMGSEAYPYEVSIVQDVHGELTCTCTCPYDMGPYCKHIAAVLYQIEETFPEHSAGKKRRAPSKPRQSREDKLRAALDSAPREALIDALLNAAGQDRQLANQLLLRFGNPETKPTYERMVKDALRSGYVEHGFIDYRGAMRAASQVGTLLDHAESLLEKGDTGQSIDVFKAVLENVTDVLQEADDSNGSLGGCVARAIEGLAMAVQRGDPVVNRSLFTYYLEAGLGERFRNWDWRWELLESAAEMVESVEQRDTLFKALDHLMLQQMEKSDRMDFLSRYRQEQIAAIKLHVIERFDGPAQAEAFIRAHAHLHPFRQDLILTCIRRGEFAEARELIKGGIAASQAQGAPGITSQYERLMLEVAQQDGDTASVIRIARDLLLKYRAEEDYAILKSAVPPEDWPVFVETLIEDAAGQRDRHLVAWLCAQQGFWPRVLALAKDDPSLLSRYQAELEQHFPDDVADIYSQTVHTMLIHAGGRSTYQSACTLLRRMKSLGKEEQVAAIVQALRARYANRRALLDELSRI